MDRRILDPGMMRNCLLPGEWSPTVLLCGADHYLKIGLQKGIAHPIISQGK